MNTKILTIALAFTAAITFSACSSSQTKETESTEETTDASAASTRSASSEFMTQSEIDSTNAQLARIDVVGFPFNVSSISRSDMSSWISANKTTIKDALDRIPPTHVLMITGHADSKGSEAGNKNISLARATYVRSQLAAAGISTKNVRVKGAGANSPKNSSNPEGSENRRATLKIVTK